MKLREEVIENFVVRINNEDEWDIYYSFCNRNNIDVYGDYDGHYTYHGVEKSKRDAWHEGTGFKGTRITAFESLNEFLSFMGEMSVIDNIQIF